MRRDESRQMFSRSGVPSVAELELGDGLLGEAEYGGVARRGVEHPVEIGGELQAAAARLVLLLFVLAVRITSQLRELT